MSRGANTTGKLRGPRFGSQHRGTCASLPARGRAAAAGEYGRGSPPPTVGVRVLSWKNFENLHVKSCILVTTTLISGLPRTCISSKQQICQGLHQFRNFNFSVVIAALVVRTKKNNQMQIMKQYLL